MYYYVGFAYMMMRRYADAIRTFSNILLYIQRTRGLFQVRLAGSWSLPPIQEVLQNFPELQFALFKFFYSAISIGQNLPVLKFKDEMGGGEHSTIVSILASDPAAPGLIPSIPDFFFR